MRLALGLAVAAFVAGFAWLVREAGRGRARLGLAACLVLVTTPYLAVWYLAWAVPLAAAEEDAVATGACLVLCALPAAADDPALSDRAVGLLSAEHDDAVLLPDDLPARVTPECGVRRREPLRRGRRRGSSAGSGRRRPSAPRGGRES